MKEHRLPFFIWCINLKHLKNNTMKKLLFVAILGTLVACGESTSTTTATDSTATVVDSTPVTPVDTAKLDTAKVDTVKVDTTKK